MPRNEYAWTDGAVLKDHTHKKLQILRTYFHNYLRVKCTPLNRKFKLAIVDGLAGGGIYEGGVSGSPMVFLEELTAFFAETEIWRKDQGLPELRIECLFIANDTSSDAWESLDPFLLAWEQENSERERLSVSIDRLRKPFEQAHSEIKTLIQSQKISNVLYNLDPCGYTQVGLHTIKDIMGSFKSPEIFYTFMVGALFNYASWDNPQKTSRLISDFGIDQETFFQDEELRTKGEWLGAVEKILHSEVMGVANFVSPFAINRAGNSGYNYWLMHFAKNHRAREVYNDVLHLNAGGQAHFGKSGLKMLDYRGDDTGVGTLDWSGDMRAKSIEALHNDLPEVISELGDAISIELLKASVYNETTAHSDDFKSVLIQNRDIEVLTQTGAQRRSASSIKDTDIVRVSRQRHLFPNLNHKKALG